MAVLHFHDGIDEILTAAWTARPKRGATEIAFLWDRENGIYRTVVDISFADFAQLVARGGVVDLMPKPTS